MKKKLLTLISIFVLLFSLTGCISESNLEQSEYIQEKQEELHQENVEKFENADNYMYAEEWVELTGDLVCDPITKIVYMRNIMYGGQYSYCPYYAPNGHPYIYDVETKTLKEINHN